MAERLPRLGDILEFYDYRHPEGHQPANASIVVKVWGNGTVNLTVFSDKGFPLATPGVLFLKDEIRPPRTPYCCFAGRKPYVEPEAKPEVKREKVKA